MTCIQGNIVLLADVIYGRVFYENGVIQKVEAGKGEADYSFGKDCLIFPGFVDKHIHPRQYPLPENPTKEDMLLHEKHLAKEDFKTLSEAAIKGGVTYVGCILNTPRPAVNQVLYDEYKNLASKSNVPVLLYAMIGPGTEPFGNDKPYKDMWSSVGASKTESDKDIVERIKSYKTVDGEKPYRIAFHCESIDELKKLSHHELHEDRRGYPVQDVATEIALDMRERDGFELDILHVSTASCLDLIIKRRMRDSKAQIFAEVTPHHLLLTRDDRKSKKLKYAGHLFMNPCLQRDQDREQLLNWLDVAIQYVSSDHAGHTLEDKANGAAGITGLQVMGPAAAELMLKYDVPPYKILKLFAHNPGKFVERFTGEKVGYLAEGYSASFTVLNLAKPIKMSDEFYTPKCGWNAWAGYEFAGSVEATFVNGEKLL